MKIKLFAALLLGAAIAHAQIPNPQIPLTGNIGSGGLFPLLNSGTLIFATDANHTMTYPEISASFLKVTSSVSLTTTRDLVAPLTIGFAFTVENLTTGGQSIQVIGATGTGVTIANGATASVFSDGTNYIQSAASSSSGPIGAPGTCTPGSALGTADGSYTPSCTVEAGSNNTFGLVALKTGTGTANTGNVYTLTFSTPSAVAPTVCQILPSSSGTLHDLELDASAGTQPPTTTGFTVDAGPDTWPTNSAGYIFLTYNCLYSNAGGSGGGGGSMVYPGAGVPNSNGSEWLTSYAVGTAANDLVQLTAGAALPAVSAANLTSFPTLNQSTTGNAATATALASTPSLCSTGYAPTGISANGNATGCAAIGSGGAPPLSYEYLRAGLSDGGAAFAGAFTRYDNNQPQAGSVAPATSALGYLLFNATPSAPQYAEVTTTLPPYWTSSGMYLQFYSSSTSGNAVMDVQTACVTAGQVVGSPTFTSATTSTTAVSATANGLVQTVLLSGIAAPGANGCPATGVTTPTMLTIRVYADATDAVPVYFTGATLVTGRSQ